MTKIFFSLLTIVVCISSKSQMKQRELKVKYVNPYISTITQIRCDSFESSFNIQIKDKEITDPLMVTAIEKELKSIIYAKVNTSIDVRSKFTFLSNNEVITICFNGLNAVLVNNRRIKKSNRLNKLLSDCMK